MNKNLLALSIVLIAISIPIPILSIKADKKYVPLNMAQLIKRMKDNSQNNHTEFDAC